MEEELARSQTCLENSVPGDGWGSRPPSSAMDVESAGAPNLFAKQCVPKGMVFESPNFRYAHVVNGDTGGFKLRCSKECSGSIPDVRTDPDSSGLGRRL